MTRLIPLGHDLWTVDGPPIRGAAGFDFPTRMCVARLPDGGLWVHSPIAPDPALTRDLASLGPVRHLVAPNDLHHSFLARWASTYPAAQVHAAPGVQAKSPGVAVDHPLDEVPPPDWADTLDQLVFAGNRITTEVVFFHRPSGTAIFTDLLQQLPEGMNRGWRATVARIDLMTASAPTVPRKFRIAFTNRRALRHSLKRLRAWPVRQMVMAHGPVVTQNAERLLARAFDWAR
ncbi:DUF4336 domain-containing protein [Mameliella alba]|uniref:DUF4336 domain-containing protein n=1 Tax=Mameliella alba TaxID=561184 RepID=UPI000B5373F9|nr:DUF4336 domain-containing protein [Mameliella alba]MBY6122433.1 DUF4336 domain-containing protein [Mameliella alba]OWV39650.1 hypothetical protein CDZ95_25220 [Mameliella alba]OWV53400.1 hypothetical protein CDZ97_25375 [Mameliella alba]